MALKQHGKVGSTPVDDMEPGQVGKILQWSDRQDCVGQLLYCGTRYRWYNLSNGGCWTTRDPGIVLWGSDCHVQLLPEGDLLVVTAGLLSG